MTTDLDILPVVNLSAPQCGFVRKKRGRSAIAVGAVLTITYPATAITTYIAASPINYYESLSAQRVRD
jgi:hypothetical protein